MNKESVNSPVSYIKFNCIQKTGAGNGEKTSKLG
jgi:hypothetical protein